MNENKAVLLTGVTGLVGSYLLKLLLSQNYKVYVIVRSANVPTEERVYSVLRFWGQEIDPQIKKKLVILEGDIQYPRFGIKSESILRSIISEVNIIFHIAALLDFKSPIDIIRKVNVEGTRNILDFALDFKKLKKINYISTAYVFGTKNDITFSEDMLELGQGFNNTYEQTKYEAEVLIKGYHKHGLKMSIFRPSMIVGDSVTGKINIWHLFYESLKLFSREIYDEFPGSSECLFNIVNIDTVARAIITLAEKQESETYHLVSPEHTNAKVFIELAAEYFGFKIPNFIPLQEFDFDKWTPTQKELAKPIVPYINSAVKVCSLKTQKSLDHCGFKYPKMDKNNFLHMFRYCLEAGFIKKRVIIKS